MPPARPPQPGAALEALVGLEGVASGFAAARDGIDSLLRDRGLRRVAPTTTGEALLRGAHASAVLAGSTSSLDDVRRDGGDEVARAALRLNVGLLKLADTLRKAPLQAIARMHVLVADEPQTAGRPVDAAAAGRLSTLAQALVAQTSAPALLVAAVAHAEVATAEPFGSRDGLVARGLERLVLVARGVDPTSVTVPEAGHLKLRYGYEAKLQEYADGGAAGVHAWLLYAAEAYAAGAEASPVPR